MDVSANPVAAERLIAIASRLAAETHPGRATRVNLDSHLERDLGFDSLTRVELVERLGSVVGHPLPDAALSDAETLRDLLAYLGGGATGEEAGPAPSLGARAAAAPPSAAASLVDTLAWHAEKQAERVHVLLYDQDQRTQAITYGALLDEASRVAGGLAARGLLPGQTVALMLPTGRDYLACFFGVLLAGGIPVPIYPPARPTQIEEHLRRHARILANAAVSQLITFAAARPVATLLRARLPQLADAATPAELTAQEAATRRAAKADDIALLQYTSGSTGDPKGVVLTHANLLANIRAFGHAVALSSEDVAVSWLPLYHDMGLIGAWLGALYHGFPLVLLSPIAFLAQPARWLRAISRHRATLSGAPNFAYELCIGKIADDELQDVDVSSWRFAFNGAEPVSPATLERFAARFQAYGFRRQALAPVYGLAEASVALAVPPMGRGPRIDRIQRAAFARDGLALPASDESDALAIPCCGHALPDHDIRIVSEAGDEVPERHVGRLEFRGPSATRGYYRNAEATRRLLHGGWLDSGDNAYLADGEVFITGRVKDLIIRGGRNLYPYDLEQAIGQVAGVRRGCVAAFAVRRPNEEERLVVVAETREAEATAVAELRRRIEAAAVDAVDMAIDDLVLAPPGTVLKTSSGKIRRLACREAYEQGRLVGGAPPAALPRTRLAWAAAAAGLRLAARRMAGRAYGLYASIVLLALAVPTGLLLALLQRPAVGRPIARAAARSFFRLLGQPVALRGLERLPSCPHVLLVNHTSYLDMLLLTAFLPARPGYAFAATQELLRSWITRAPLTGLGTLFLERFDAAQGLEGVDTLVQALRRGENLLVFPEGTFTRESGLRPFRLGSFAAAVQAGVPMVVAGIRGARLALRDETWLLRRAAIEFEVGSIHEPAGNDWNSALRLKDAARRAMLPLCGEPDLAP